MQGDGASSKLAGVTGPHAHPFRMIDRVLERGPDRCTVVKAVTAGELAPDAAAMPGDGYPPWLVLEALSQAALPLAGSAAGAGGPGVIAAIQGARVLRPVRPGERLTITASITARLGGMIRVSSRACVGEEPVAEGEFTIATGGPPAPGGEAP